MYSEDVWEQAVALRRHKGKIPHGTCQLYPIRNAATLYEYYRGQRDRLLASALLSNPA